MASIIEYNLNDIKTEGLKGRAKVFIKALNFLLFCLLIFTISSSGVLFFSILSIIYTFVKYTITFKWVSGIVQFAKYTYQCALSVDQTGNVTCQEVFNDTMIKRNRKGHIFGDEDDTISYCLAKNGQHDSLSLFGKFWYWFLDTVDRKDGGHMFKALRNKDIKDLEACERLKNKGVISYEKLDG